MSWVILHKSRYGGIIGLLILVGLFPQPSSVGQKADVLRVGPEAWTKKEELLVDLPEGEDLRLAQADEEVRLVRFPLGFAPSRSNNAVYSADGRVGFVASLFNDRLLSFDTTTGEMLGSVLVGVDPGGITLNEQPVKRIIAVKNFTSDDVTIVDATDPTNLRVQATFTPPPGTDFWFSIGRTTLSRDGKIGFIASERRTNKLYLFDTETGALLSTVTVSGYEPVTMPVVENSGRRWVAVVSDWDGYITMVDVTSPNAPSIVWSRQYCFDNVCDFADNNIVFNSEGTIGYVAHSGNTVFSFRVSDGSVISSWYLGSGRRPRLLAFNQLTGTLVVTNAGNGTVSILRATQEGSLSGQATFTPPDGAGLHPLNNPVLSPDGELGFVASSQTNRLYAFRTSNGTLVTSVPFQGRSYTVEAFRVPGRRFISVVNTDFSPSVAIVDYTEVEKIAPAVEFRPYGAAFSTANNTIFSSDGRTVFVASAFTDLLFVVDAETGDILDALVPGDGPRQLTLFDQDGVRWLIVVNANEGTLAAVDASNPRDLKLVRKIVPPSGTSFTAFTNAVISPDGQFIFVADYGGDRVLGFDALSGTLVSGALIEQGPVRIAYNAVSRRLATVNVKLTATLKGLTEVELNDSIAQAQVIFPNATIEGDIYWGGDADFFAFDARRGQQLVIDLDGRSLTPPSPLDPVVTLFDSRGQQLAENDDAEGSTDSLLRFVIPADGRYFFRVRSDDGRGRPDYIYRATVTLTCPQPTVALVEVDRFGNLSRKGTFVPPCDSDFYPWPNVTFGLRGDIGYVPSFANQTVFSFDAGGRLIASRRLPGNPLSLTLSGDGRLLAVSLEESVAVLQVSEAGDFSLLAVLPSPSYIGWDDVVFNERGDIIYLAANEIERRGPVNFLVNGAVVTYDLEGKERDRVATGEGARSLSLSSRGQLVAVAASNRLALIDPKIR
ncbi:MAG TPA: pre-peptidase C-terminal domain-containing protein [Blastocatellia bacterium]|nr:pre-peptidase C-terminal domain-containing protein [Blastocatellia bacterium]